MSGAQSFRMMCTSHAAEVREAKVISMDLAASNGCGPL